MKNEKKMRAEIKAELEREMLAKLEQQRINRNTYTRVMNDFEEEFKKFDWKQENIVTRPLDGTTCLITTNHPEASKVRDAIGTLARIAFQARNKAGIPSNKEKQLRKITQGILDIVFSEMG